MVTNAGLVIRPLVGLIFLVAGILLLRSSSSRAGAWTISVGALLYAANMDSDTIVVFRVDAGSGKLTPSGQVIKTGSPSSIVFR